MPGDIRKTPERLRYGHHLKVCEEADTCHATLSPFPSLDPNSFYFFRFSIREGRSMTSMLRISAFPLLPPSHFPFSASFFRPPPVSSFFLLNAKALRNPRHSRGAFYLQRNAHLGISAFWLPLPARTNDPPVRNIVAPLRLSLLAALLVSSCSGAACICHWQRRCLSQ